jgi:hypothetical protein
MPLLMKGGLPSFLGYPAINAGFGIRLDATLGNGVG